MLKTLLLNENPLFNPKVQHFLKMLFSEWTRINDDSISLKCLLIIIKYDYRAGKALSDGNVMIFGIIRAVMLAFNL